MASTAPKPTTTRHLYNNITMASRQHGVMIDSLRQFNKLTKQFNSLHFTSSRHISTISNGTSLKPSTNSTCRSDVQYASQLLQLSAQITATQKQLFSSFTPQLQQRLFSMTRSAYQSTTSTHQSQIPFNKLNIVTKRQFSPISTPKNGIHAFTKNQQNSQYAKNSTQNSQNTKNSTQNCTQNRTFNNPLTKGLQSRPFSTTPPIPDGPLIKPTGTPIGFGNNKAPHPAFKPPPPVANNRKIVSQTPEFYTHSEPLMGSHPSLRQAAEAEAYAVPTPPENVAMVKRKHTIRGWIWDFAKTTIFATSIWVTLSTAIFLRLEYIRSKCLSDFVHVYFPQDLLSDPLTIGYLENYNNLLLEHIITAIRGVYTAKTHPELVPAWLREMVTLDGELMNPLEDQPPETLLELCDILSASRGFGALTTVFTQFHETYLQRQLKQGGRPPGISIASYLYTYLQNRGWDGTPQQLDAFEDLAQFEMESELCLPLVREHLHKFITSLLVPPQAASQPSSVIQYLKGVVDFFSSTDPSLSQQQQQQQQQQNQQMTPSVLNNALSPDWDKAKSAQFNQIKSLITHLYRETPLPSLIKQRRNKIEQLYVREQIPFTASLNEAHHQIQLGRYETLRFVLNTLRSYETNLIATPHKLQQYAGNNQIIMSLEDVRLLIQYTQQTLDQINILVEKYRTPVKEQVTRQLCLDFPILGWLLQHESTTLGLFFSQREKLVLNHFNQLDEVSNYTNYLAQRNRALSDLPLNNDSLSLIPNTWSSLPSISSSPLVPSSSLLPLGMNGAVASNRSENVNYTIVPVDQNFQRDYVNTITQLELEGTLSKWNGETSFHRSDAVEGWTVTDLSTLAPPQAYQVGDKLMIPIVDILDPLNSQAYTPEDLNSGLSGLLNSVYSWFGAGKPFGKTTREHLITLEDALQRGYVNKVQYDHLVSQNEQRRLVQQQQQHLLGIGDNGVVNSGNNEGQGFIDMGNGNRGNSDNSTNTTRSSTNTGRDDKILSPYLTIDPSPVVQAKTPEEYLKAQNDAFAKQQQQRQQGQQQQQQQQPGQNLSIIVRP